MRYDNDSVRRRDRLMDEQRARELLREGEYGVLSLCEDGVPYGIPINFVWDGQDAIYLHCAPQGRKWCCLSSEDRVSFCVVGRTHVLSAQFTTEYESLVLCGTARVVDDPQQKREALRRLLEKYAPQDVSTGLKYMEKSLPRTAVWCLEIESFSGKCKKIRTTK